MQKGFAPIFILVGIVVIALVAGGGYYFLKLKIPEPKVCTMEAKICPDGSSVGRAGPNCEFAPCTKFSPSPTSGIERISWDVPAGSIPQIEEQELRRAAISSIDKQSDWTYISITKVTISGNWALLNAEDKSRNSAIPVSGVYEFLAQKIKSGWRVITPDDSDFCDLLKRAPSTLVGSDPLDYYIGCRK